MILLTLQKPRDNRPRKMKTLDFKDQANKNYRIFLHHFVLDSENFSMFNGTIQLQETQIEEARVWGETGIRINPIKDT